MSIRSVRGEVYNINKTGSSTDPWGTPKMKADLANWWTFTNTNCFPSEWYDYEQNQFNAITVNARILCKTETMREKEGFNGQLCQKQHKTFSRN